MTPPPPPATTTAPPPPPCRRRSPRRAAAASARFAAAAAARVLASTEAASAAPSGAPASPLGRRRRVVVSYLPERREPREEIAAVAAAGSSEARQLLARRWCRRRSGMRAAAAASSEAGALERIAARLRRGGGAALRAALRSDIRVGRVHVAVDEGLLRCLARNGAAVHCLDLAGGGVEAAGLHDLEALHVLLVLAQQAARAPRRRLALRRRARLESASTRSRPDRSARCSCGSSLRAAPYRSTPPASRNSGSSWRSDDDRGARAGRVLARTRIAAA